MSLRIGIDIGGVCLVDSESYESSVTGDEKKVTDDVVVKGCLDALAELKQQGHYLVIVSFCGRKRAENTRQHELSTYFDEAYFVKKRPHKAKICQNRGLDLLIDDRSDILACLDSQTTKVKFGTHPSDFAVTFKPDHHVQEWAEVLNITKKMKAKNRPIGNPEDLKDLVY